MKTPGAPLAAGHGARRNPTIGFVGAGRIATALAPAMNRLGWPVSAVASRSPSSAARLVASIPGCQAAPTPQAAADRAEIVFLTVPDDAIRQVCSAIDWRPGLAAVHCSGAWGIELLSAAADQGAATGAFHPLQTFAGADAPLSGVSVAIDAEEALRGLLERLASDLGCYPFALPPEARAIYHASATFAGNYLVTLLASAASLWASFAPGEALPALLPLVKTTLANVEALGPARALTGPLARADVDTVRRHLGALSQAAPELADLYRRLGLTTLRLAAAGGGYPQDKAETLRAIFQSSSGGRTE